MTLIIGTAGWSIPGIVADSFARDGTALQRYATVFRGVEINSSFHRPHRRATWTRWADSVPDDFRFSVKLPKTITHLAKLVDCAPLVADFLEQLEPLSEKLSVLLVQLPPKLALDEVAAARFFDLLTGRCSTQIVCEPRHPSWFEDQAGLLLARLGVARVAADPAPVPAAAAPAGWPGIRYFRLHGSPITYRSSYDPDRLEAYARAIRSRSQDTPVWCIFDNTATSAATENALSMLNQLDGRAGQA